LCRGVDDFVLCVCTRIRQFTEKMSINTPRHSDDLIGSVICRHTLRNVRKSKPTFLLGYDAELKLATIYFFDEHF